MRVTTIIEGSWKHPAFAPAIDFNNLILETLRTSRSANSGRKPPYRQTDVVYSTVQ